jgi:hypothetical protein
MKYRIIVFLIAAGHLLLIFTNIASLFILPFLAAWYIACPLCSFILLNMFDRGDRCPITTLENYYRRKAKMPLIRGFVGHYIYGKQTKNNV